MASTLPKGAPASSLAQRVAPWFVLVVVLVVGIILCLALGPRVVPYFAGNTP